MRKTYITAAVIALATILWFASGALTAGEGPREHPSLAEANELARASVGDMRPTAVRGRVVHAVALPERVTVRGRTENKRTVDVRAETSGRVVERPLERGARVAEGDLLCRLAVEDRKARLAQAEAAVEQARIEYEGSLRLRDRGFNSETAIAQAKARLATAEAQREAAVLDVERTQVRAPFAGMVEDTPLEVGDYAQPGTVCASLVDLHPMLLVGRVSERDVSRFGVGATAAGRLMTGQQVSGPVSFVGQQADPGTRTYRVEVTVPNPDYALRSGITTEIAIDVGAVEAHKISPAVLALDDAGNIGVRIVDAQERVYFQRVAIVADADDGVWVRGLPAVATLITVGQELVVAGERVDVQLQSERPLHVRDAPARSPAPTAGASGSGAAS